MVMDIGNEKSPFKILQKNEILFKQGEIAKYIYIVAAGSLACVKENNKRLTPILNAQEKSILGLEVFSNTMRNYNYSAIANERVELVPVPISLLENFFDSSPDFMENLLKTLIGKIVHTTELIGEHRIIDENLSPNSHFSDEEEARLKNLLK